MGIKKLWLGMLAMALAFGMTVGGCDSGLPDGNDPQTVTYRGSDLAGNEYFLTISSDARTARSGGNPDNFSLKIEFGGKEAVSSGTIVNIADDGTYTLLASDDSEFAVTIKDDEISSIVGNITLEDGSTFIVRTFNTIYLRACRWTSDHPDGDYQWGENYNSGDSVRLKDIYDGNLDDLVKDVWSDKFKVRISGTVDIDLNNMALDLQYLANDNSSCTIVGGGWPPDAENRYFKIGAGDFSLELELSKNELFDTNTLPEGEVVLSFVETIAWHSENEPVSENIIDGAMPDSVPDWTIMAAIRNLTITPVDDGNEAENEPENYSFYGQLFNEATKNAVRDRNGWARSIYQVEVDLFELFELNDRWIGIGKEKPDNPFYLERDAVYDNPESEDYPWYVDCKAAWNSNLGRVYWRNYLITADREVIDEFYARIIANKYGEIDGERGMSYSEWTPPQGESRYQMSFTINKYLDANKFTIGIGMQYGDIGVSTNFITLEDVDNIIIEF